MPPGRESKGEIRTSRWTPISDCSRPYAPSPFTSKVDGLDAGASPSSRSVTTAPKPLRSVQRRYMRMQHLSPVLALRAAAPGMDRDDGAAVVVFAGEQHRRFELLQRLRKRRISRSSSDDTSSPSRMSSNRVSRSDTAPPTRGRSRALPRAASGPALFFGFVRDEFQKSGELISSSCFE